MTGDELQLCLITTEILDWLCARDIPATPRNIIHAMYKNYYADWLGGKSLHPDCEFELTTHIP